MKSSWIKSLFGYTQLDVTMVRDIDELAQHIILKRLLCDTYAFVRSEKCRNSFGNVNFKLLLC